MGVTISAPELGLDSSSTGPSSTSFAYRPGNTVSLGVPASLYQGKTG
jgi:hypothetical protein